MKNRNIFGILIMLFFSLKMISAPVFNDPVTLTQPDGSLINCFLSGDEYYNYYHDKEGFTIIMGDDGYYYYGKSIGTKIIATAYKVGSIDPAITGLKPFESISPERYQELKAELYAPLSPKKSNVKNPDQGKFTNIVIFVSFKGEGDYPLASRNTLNTRLNGPKESLKDFYYQSSYGKSDMNSYLFPITSVSLSYNDTNPISYYQPYSGSNPNGYTDAADRKTREQILVKSAIDYINDNSPVPDTLNIDNDEDGRVDNVMLFVNAVEGTQSNLLWAHRWTLTATNAEINGKTVFSYHIIPRNKADVYTMAHEMFHTFGAPDLYTASPYLNMRPVGVWDIMAHKDCELGAYMRYKYTNHQWITTMPEIVDPGTYKLKPVTSKDSNCFVIKSPVSEHEFFVLEYRKKVRGTYDTTLDGEGLLIYRIDSLFYGNNDFDSNKTWNEIYIYRPGRSTNNFATESVNILKAPFGVEDRTQFNSFSSYGGYNPARCLLTYGDKGGLDISEISISGNYAMFTFNGFDVEPTLTAVDTLYMESKRNALGVITMNTNISTWRCTSNEDWARVVTNDYQTKKISLRAFTENTGYDREALLTISINDNILKTIVVIQNGPLGTGVTKEIVNFETSIAPNPITDIMHINAPYPVQSVSIYDAKGVEMLTQSIMNNSAEINCANLLPGTYTVHLITERGNERHKMIKQ